MAVDLSKTTFKYTVKQDGSVDYTADADGVLQNLSGRDTSSQEALEADLANYTRAYVAGLQLTQPRVAADIQVNQQKTADAKES